MNKIHFISRVPLEEWFLQCLKKFTGKSGHYKILEKNLSSRTTFSDFCTVDDDIVESLLFEDADIVNQVCEKTFAIWHWWKECNCSIDIHSISNILIGHRNKMFLANIMHTARTAKKNWKIKLCIVLHMESKVFRYQGNKIKTSLRVFALFFFHADFFFN